MKNILAILALAFAFVTSSAAIADEPAISLKKPSVFGGTYKFALDSYDSTSYFAASGPVKGTKEFSTEIDGTTWLFASQENLNKFKADPDKYRPQYGNYCAYALSEGYLAAGDPEVYAVHNGKLYLNYNKTAQKTWDKNRDERIDTANGEWPVILKK